MNTQKHTLLKAILIYSLSLFFISCNTNKEAYESRESFEELERYYVSNLEQIVSNLKKIETEKSLDKCKMYFTKSKMHFKQIEAILANLEFESYNYLNQPNILKVEEEDATSIKTTNPTGFQVLEELIYENNVNLIPEIKNNAKLTADRITLLKHNRNFKFLKNHHILWLIRDGFVRIAFKGITGFDATKSYNSIQESKYVYEGLKKVITIFKSNFKNQNLFLKWKTSFSNANKQLGNNDFNKLDRFNFIKIITHNQLLIWNETVKDWNVNFEIKQPLNYGITSLFSSNTFNLEHFSTQKDPSNKEKMALGKELFYDTNLSANNTMSCATCHKPELAFTDGLKIKEGTTRNAPTLTYASLQKSFFYDRRAGSLEGQIIDVVNNPNEFHTSLDILEKNIAHNKKYVAKFLKTYKEKPNQDIIRQAIASFVISLNKFNSKFDKNISSFENTMTADEISGFNIFMGKGKCATCHFLPTFNGLVPMDFRESEIENIGVPATNDTLNPKMDSDLGRYLIYKTQNRKHFFKTPTLRNITNTAPYMHNGVFNSLEEVVDFYNAGGGVGRGIKNQYQTLPSDNLKLTKTEKKNLIAFLKTLTDR